MPNEKQLTPMQVLRGKLQRKLYDMELRGEKYSPYYTALTDTVSNITTEMLAIEKEQKITDYEKGGSDYYNDIDLTGEHYYLQTYKTE